MTDENPLFKMSDDELLAELANKAEIHAREILVKEQHAEMVPLWHVVTKAQNMIIGTPWRDDDQKALCQGYIRNLLKTEGGRAYCMTSEAWMAKYAENEIDIESAKWPAIRPIDRKDRMEVVTIFATTRSKQLMRTFETIRDKDGKITDLKLEISNEKPDAIRGAMPSLFDDA